MKAKVCPVKSQGLGLACQDFKISKHREGSESEMQECFLKLSELVPTIPSNTKLSKVQLLQHVIDYILDLELTLDFHPATVNTCPPKLLHNNCTERKPLGECTQLNTMPAQQSHLEKVELAGCSSRPASC